MTPTKQQIEEAAENRFPEYPDNGETTNHDAYFEAKQDAFIAGAEWALSQNRWIPVEEALPERDAGLESVNVSVECNVTDGDSTSTDRYDFRRNEWSNYACITHWQPLPTPPTK